MKVLLVHKFFYRRGGSEACVLDTAALLESRGHRVSHFSMADPRNEASPWSRYFVSPVDLSAPGLSPRGLAAALRILYSAQAARRIRALIRDERPEIAHLHAIYHQISPSILPVLSRRGIPIVMTLHDYHLLCPVYTLFRGGRVCEECATGRTGPCLRHRCVRGSGPRSLLAAAELHLHRRVFRFYDRVDLFLCPSLFLRNMMAALEGPRRLAHLPNFALPDPGLSAAEAGKGGEGPVLFFGRLSPEKGLATLLKAVAGTGIRLDIAGEGPERPRLERLAAAGGGAAVRFLGRLSRAEIAVRLRRAPFSVCPSEWYENSPRSVIESLAAGRPVVGSRIGGIPELIEDGETGLTFAPGDAADLRSKILRLLEDRAGREKMGARGRELAGGRLGPEAHYAGLMAAYRRAATGGG